MAAGGGVTCDAIGAVAPGFSTYEDPCSSSSSSSGSSSSSSSSSSAPPFCDLGEIGGYAAAYLDTSECSTLCSDTCDTFGYTALLDYELTGLSSPEPLYKCICCCSE